MSDTAPKQRSFLAAYGPLIAVGAVLALVSAVLFSMNAETVPGIPNPEATPKQKTVVAKQVVMDEVRRLVKSGKMGWDALSKEEQDKLNAATNDQGEMIYGYGVRKVVEELENEKKGGKGAPATDASGVMVVTPPQAPVKTN